MDFHLQTSVVYFIGHLLKLTLRYARDYLRLEGVFVFQYLLTVATNFLKRQGIENNCFVGENPRARQQKATIGTFAHIHDIHSHSRVFCAGKISDSFYRSIGRCSLNHNGNEYTTFLVST